jgi:hypothetical protein
MSDTCKDVILDIIEMIDDKIGGPLMDITYVDEMEKTFVSCLVDELWTGNFEDILRDDVLPWSA